jgi:2-polyprenyl-6-methoxyphenol hydroxylase-like FAD-dependent oxidoreductase
LEEAQMVKALIAGGGVAGPVTAMALQRAGIEAVVYEAHVPGSDEAGSYLTVATNGLDALRAIDADGPVLAAGFPTPTNVLLSGSGRRLGAFSNGGTLPDGTVSHTVKRARLYRALHDEAAARGIRMEYGRRLVGAETTPGGGVVAAFDDGGRERGDLLVGADGVHSPTRRLLDPAAPAGRYVGLVNFGGYTPGSAGTAEPGSWRMIFGRRAFFGYVADPGGGTVWFANVPRPAVTPAERTATTPEQWQRQLVELFAGDHGPASELVAGGVLELAGDSTHDLPTVPTWHKGPMVIVGDAAHAPSPTSGQGASMAAEDGVVLAQCLRDLPSIPGALAVYEGRRRARVERIVAQGARTGSAKTPGPVGRVLRDLALPLVFKLLVTERSMAWIHDHHIDWDAPVTAGA